MILSILLLLAPLGILLLAIIFLVPVQVTANLEVEREVLANFRIRWLLVERRWQLRWPLPGGQSAPVHAAPAQIRAQAPAVRAQAPAAPGAPDGPGGTRRRPPNGPGHSSQRPSGGATGGSQRYLRTLWPRVRRRLRWRQVALDLILGPADRPDLAAVGCGWLWGAITPVLAWLGVPREVLRVGIRPAVGREVSRGSLYGVARLRTLDGLWLGWQAYRIGRSR